MKSEVISKLIKLISESETAVLSSIDENGYPRTIVMSNISAESLDTIYFATGTHSKKVKHYLENPKAGVSYNDGISLIGEVEVIEDNKLKGELWQESFIEHFPKGETDPDYCVLKFTSKSALVYIDNIYTTIPLPAQEIQR